MFTKSSQRKKTASVKGFTPTHILAKLFYRGETAHGGHRKNSCRGFTLIEMLVAITVLLLSIGGPLTIAAQAVLSSNIARDRLTAAYLAQEGIEMVRRYRDKNAIGGSSWLNGLTDCTGGGACYIGAFSNLVSSCSGDCPPINFNNDESSSGYGAYGYGAQPPSIFTRTISIEEILPDQEARVTSEVEWQAGGRTHRVTLTENIFNWR